MDMRLKILNLHPSRTRRLLLFSFLLLTVTACIQPILKIQPIYVEEMVMTQGIEDDKPIDQLTVFKPDVGRIYCFARIPVSANEKLTLQWYYEDKLIGATENVVSTQGQVYWFLEREGIFPEGGYRVELYNGTVPLKSLSFKVEK